jgi:hypothetical protein
MKPFLSQPNTVKIVEKKDANSLDIKLQSSIKM